MSGVRKINVTVKVFQGEVFRHKERLRERIEEQEERMLCDL